MDTRPWIPVDCLLLMFPSFFTQLDSLFIFSAKPDCLMLVFCTGKLSFCCWILVLGLAPGRLWSFTSLSIPVPAQRPVYLPLSLLMALRLNFSGRRRGRAWVTLVWYKTYLPLHRPSLFKNFETLCFPSLEALRFFMCSSYTISRLLFALIIVLCLWSY